MSNFNFRSIINNINAIKTIIACSRNRDFLFTKGNPVVIYTILDTNYYYSFSGPIRNIRSRGYMSSILLRSRRFGAEQRFFLSSPQLRALVVCISSPNKVKKD